MREGRLRRMIDAVDITTSELEALYLEETERVAPRE